MNAKIGVCTERFLVSFVKYKILSLIMQRFIGLHYVRGVAHMHFVGASFTHLSFPSLPPSLSVAISFHHTLPLYARSCVCARVPQAYI